MVKIRRDAASKSTAAGGERIDLQLSRLDGICRYRPIDMMLGPSERGCKVHTERWGLLVPEDLERSRSTGVTSSKW